MMMRVPRITEYMLVFMGMSDHMRMCCPIMRMSHKMLVFMVMDSDQSISDHKNRSHKHDQKRSEIRWRQYFAQDQE